jgi:hypothetical protein
MAKGNEKTYSLRGKVTKVYEPREVVMTFGGKKVVKEVSDLYLQLDNGVKVKVSFWDTDISHHEGSIVVLSALVFKGKYKDVPQYSATKETKISVAKKGAGAAKAEEPEDEQPEGATLEEVPQFGEDGAPVEEVPEGAIAEDEEPAGAEEEVAETPAPVKAKVAAKPKATAVKKVTKTEPDVYVVSPSAIAVTKALAHAACDIADEVAPEIVKENAQAYQALFATIFINLGLKDYKENK